MSDVLISIKPEWVDKIIKGEKTIELRKTFPKQVTPFRCFIYVSKDFKANDPYDFWASRGKVIGEANIVKDITTHSLGYYKQCGDDCLSDEQRESYLGGKIGHGWRIGNVKIYDVPKALSEFGLNRPPQSWQYVRVSPKW